MKKKTIARAPEPHVKRLYRRRRETRNRVVIKHCTKFLKTTGDPKCTALEFYNAYTYYTRRIRFFRLSYVETLVWRHWLQTHSITVHSITRIVFGPSRQRIVSTRVAYERISSCLFLLLLDHQCVCVCVWTYYHTEHTRDTQRSIKYNELPRLISYLM